MLSSFMWNIKISDGDQSQNRQLSRQERRRREIKEILSLASRIKSFIPDKIISYHVLDTRYRRGHLCIYETYREGHSREKNNLSLHEVQREVSSYFCLLFRFSVTSFLCVSKLCVCVWRLESCICCVTPCKIHFLILL